jgi:hypothetical protein
MTRAQRRRRRVRRAIIVVPSLFTLANLFFGIWAIVLASQGQFYLASWWIVIAGVLDMLDGQLARWVSTPGCSSTRSWCVWRCGWPASTSRRPMVTR